MAEKKVVVCEPKKDSLATLILKVLAKLPENPDELSLECLEQFELPKSDFELPRFTLPRSQFNFKKYRNGKEKNNRRRGFKSKSANSNL